MAIRTRRRRRQACAGLWWCIGKPTLHDRQQNRPADGGRRSSVLAVSRSAPTVPHQSLYAKHPTPFQTEDRWAAFKYMALSDDCSRKHRLVVGPVWARSQTRRSSATPFKAHNGDWAATILCRVSTAQTRPGGWFDSLYLCFLLPFTLTATFPARCTSTMSTSQNGSVEHLWHSKRGNHSRGSVLTECCTGSKAISQARHTQSQLPWRYFQPYQSGLLALVKSLGVGSLNPRLPLGNLHQQSIKAVLVKPRQCL